MKLFLNAASIFVIV